MKKLNLCGVILSLLFMTSCHNSVPSGTDLSISLNPTRTKITTHGVADSCVNIRKASAASTSLPSDLSAPYFSFRNLSIYWNKSANLIITGLKISLRHANIKDGDYEADLSDSEIQALFEHTTNANKFDGVTVTYYFGSDSDGDGFGDSTNTLPMIISSHSDCGVTFSGLLLEDYTQYMSVVGAVTLTGYTEEDGAASREYLINGSVIVDYNP